MNGEFHGLRTLESAVGAIASAGTPSEVFRALLEGTSCGTPRAAVFLHRAGNWKGWGGSGYGTAPARALRSLTLGEREGWLARVAASEEKWVVAEDLDDVPRFGQSPHESAIGLPVRVGGKAVAAIVAERGVGEAPWHPEALAVLVCAARLRLEFDLAWRRLRAAGTSHPDAPSPAAPDSETPFESPAAEVPAVPAVPAVQMDAWEEPRPAAAVDPTVDEAKRFAKLVASDIRLYNEAAIAQGKLQRDLASRLEEEMQRGRETFERRFPGLGPRGKTLLREAYVEVLAAGDASLIPAD